MVIQLSPVETQGDASYFYAKVLVSWWDLKQSIRGGWLHA